MQACADQTDFLLVAYDIEARGPLARIAHSQGILGVALVLSVAQADASMRMQLAVTETASAQAAHSGAANAMAASLPLIAALQRKATEDLSLPLGPESSLEVRVRHA